MMLWRVVNGMAEFSARDAEIIFQSTLDSISQAWCVRHYPVSKYVIAARHAILEKGLEPDTVKQALNRQTADPAKLQDEVYETPRAILDALGMERVFLFGLVLYRKAAESRGGSGQPIPILPDGFQNDGSRKQKS